jgi:hypothetical protein
MQPFNYTMFFDGLIVDLGSIAFMLGKLIGGINLV